MKFAMILTLLLSGCVLNSRRSAQGFCSERKDIIQQDTCMLRFKECNKLFTSDVCYERVKKVYAYQTKEQK